jgi:aspartyl/glutamyl-tRNA(Asn/Gln) amidotransferase C subunit
MSITLETLQAVAKLAYIELNASVDIMYAKLLSIDQAVELLKKIDTEGIEPFKHCQFSSKPLREDIITCQNKQQELANLARNFTNYAYQIPIILNNPGK